MHHYREKWEINGHAKAQVWGYSVMEHYRTIWLRQEEKEIICNCSLQVGMVSWNSTIDWVKEIYSISVNFEDF